MWVSLVMLMKKVVSSNNILFVVEWDLGGFPAWLLAKKPALKLRSSDRAYLQLVHFPILFLLIINILTCTLNQRSADCETLFPRMLLAAIDHFQSSFIFFWLLGIRNCDLLCLSPLLFLSLLVILLFIYFNRIASSTWSY